MVPRHPDLALGHAPLLRQTGHPAVPADLPLSPGRRGEAGPGQGRPRRAKKGALAGELVLLSQDEARFQMVPSLTATLGVKGHRPVVGTWDCKDVLYVLGVLNLVSGAVHANTLERLQAENRRAGDGKTRRMQRAFA